MDNGEKPGWAVRIFGPLLFIFFPIGAFVAFFYDLSLFFGSLSGDLVVIMKGSFYMLGVGVTLLPVTFAAIQGSWLEKPLTQKQASALTKLGVGGVILMFTLPHVIHYAMGSVLEGRGYSVCDAASHQWLHYRDIVYIRQPLECTKDVEKRFNEKREPLDGSAGRHRPLTPPPFPRA
jgi:hypothetical protein